MASNASRGAAAKARTKKWLQECGYLVADMEKMYFIWTPKGRIPVKRDQLGADLLALLPAVGLRFTGPYPFRSDVVFVQVTNPASRPMRLTKLEYTFAAHGSTVATGAVPLRRDVPAGAAVVVEVPLEGGADGELTLRGKLTAELDQVVRIFTVSATTAAR